MCVHMYTEHDTYIHACNMLKLDSSADDDHNYIKLDWDDQLVIFKG